MGEYLRCNRQLHPLLAAYEQITNRAMPEGRTGNIIPSANLISFTVEKDGLPIKYTRRVAFVRPGLIPHPYDPQSYVWPGGAWEPHDASLLETATREALEEMGSRGGARTGPILHCHRFILTPFQTAQTLQLTTNAELGFLHTDFFLFTPHALPAPDGSLLLLAPPGPHPPSTGLPPLEQAITNLQQTNPAIRIISPNLDLREFRAFIQSIVQIAPPAKDDASEQTIIERIRKMDILDLYLFYLHHGIATYDLRYVADYAALASLMVITQAKNPKPQLNIPAQHVLYHSPNDTSVYFEIAHIPVELRLIRTNSKYYILIKEIPESTLARIKRLHQKARIEQFLLRTLPDTSTLDHLEYIKAPLIYTEICKRLQLQCKTWPQDGWDIFHTLDQINHDSINPETIKEALQEQLKQRQGGNPKPSGRETQGFTRRAIIAISWMAIHPNAPLTPHLAKFLRMNLPEDTAPIRQLLAETFIL